MRFFTRPLLALLCTLGAVRGGGTAVERQEFKQSTTYPYVFRPICYLATSGPLALRFSVSPPECGDRRAPALPPAAKNTPKPEPPPAPVTPPPVEPKPAAITMSSGEAAPAYPPPTNAPAPKPATVDFAQFPAELVEAFKRGRDSVEARNYLFDPIFQPALPQDLPTSKATYRQK